MRPCYHLVTMTEITEMSGVDRRLFDIEEYHRMGEVGILNEDDHIELIEGRLFDSKTGYERPIDTQEYHLMIEAGIIREGARVELVGGEIVEMAAMGSRHASCMRRLDALLNRVTRGNAQISTQCPIQVGDHAEPEPDVALLKPREDFYSGMHPSPDDILLVIELSDTTLLYDREVKLPLYARAGIPEAWIVNLPAETVEVHSRPATGEYRETLRAKRGEFVESKMLPSLRLAIDDILG
ncbi:hypothetical protein BH18ACT11_BH18ACT11_13740 [soil metagenome]